MRGVQARSDISLNLRRIKAHADLACHWRRHAVHRSSLPRTTPRAEPSPEPGPVPSRCIRRRSPWRHRPGVSRGAGQCHRRALSHGARHGVVRLGGASGRIPRQTGSAAGRRDLGRGADDAKRGGLRAGDRAFRPCRAQPRPAVRRSRMAALALRSRRPLLSADRGVVGLAPPPACRA